MSRGMWLQPGTRLLLDAVDRLRDTDFDAPTRLPGWTRRHVIAHVHYNAEALRRLVRWARTGEPCPMYAGSEQRANEIDTGSRLAPGVLRELVHTSARHLAADLAALTAPAWRTTVVTAQGRRVPAAEIPWLRTREVVVHAIDLDAGVDFADLPDELNAALAADALTRRAAQGHAADLARWLTGRAAAAPDLGPWL